MSWHTLSLIEYVAGAVLFCTGVFLLMVRLEQDQGADGDGDRPPAVIVPLDFFRDPLRPNTLRTPSPGGARRRTTRRVVPPQSRSTGRQLPGRDVGRAAGPPRLGRCRMNRLPFNAGHKGGAYRRPSRSTPVAFREPEARFTIADVIADDEREHPIALQEQLERLDRHDDEVIAQRRIDEMCARNSKPLTSAVLSVGPAHPQHQERAA